MKSRKTEKKLKQQICHLNNFLSFHSNIWQILMETKTRNLEWKTKQQISHVNDLLYSLFNIMTGSNWLNFSLVQNGETVRFYVVKILNFHIECI